MITWLNLSEKRQKEILNQVSNKTGLPEYAIEKDWWVTLCLKAVFNTPVASSLIFKGGTSLSKAWDLIERFSEDIDLGLDKSALGFGETLSNTQIKKLREASCNFISHDFKYQLEKALLENGISQNIFTLSVKEGADDSDPQILLLAYQSVLSKNPYIVDRVIIEIGSRGLQEPISQRPIQSIIGTTYSEQEFADKPFFIATVEPKRTFLEKAFLLHEEFSKPHERIRHDRLSRHLYDLDRLMDTEHGHAALQDKNLYQTIVEHRSRFNKIQGIDYTTHLPSHINFIPPDAIIKLWEADYKAMRENMIYGEAHDFKKLILRMQELTERFRSNKWQ